MRHTVESQCNFTMDRIRFERKKKNTRGTQNDAIFIFRGGRHVSHSRCSSYDIQKPSIVQYIFAKRVRRHRWNNFMLWTRSSQYMKSNFHIYFHSCQYDWLVFVYQCAQHKNRVQLCAVGEASCQEVSTKKLLYKRIYHSVQRTTYTYHIYHHKTYVCVCVCWVTRWVTRWDLSEGIWVRCAQ